MSMIIGITMGDPTGVGPEIAVKAVSEMSAGDQALTRIYGDRPTLALACKSAGVTVNLDDLVVDLPIDGALIVSVGALIPRKGQVFAIEALAQIPEARLAIIGDGPELTMLRQAARDQGVADVLWEQGRNSAVKAAAATSTGQSEPT